MTTFIYVFFKAIEYFVWAYVILSWLPKDNPTLARINEIVDSVVEPIMKPFRKIVPVVDLGGMAIDLAPFVVIILLMVVVEPLVFRIISF